MIQVIIGIIIGLGLSDIWRYWISRMQVRAAYQEMIRANDELLATVTIPQLEEALRKKKFDAEMTNQKEEGSKDAKKGNRRRA